MSPFIYILLFIASGFVLAKAGVLAVDSLLLVGKFLRWKKFVVGSLIMGLLSSMPELFVGISSAINGKPALAFGTIVGSNIVLLTLIAPVAILFGGTIKLKSKTIQRSLIFSGFYALLPLLLLVDGQFSRGDGILLIIALGFYLRELLSHQKKFSQVLVKRELQGKKQKDYKLFFRNFIKFLIGLSLLILSAQGIVFSAGRLALSLDLPLVFIGAIAVALGTSLPELSFGLRSIIMKQKQMFLGTIFGSVALNSSLILGLTCLISPFKIYNIGLYINGFIFTGLAVLFFLIFFKTGDKLTKKEAKFLLFIYILFFIIQILIK